MASLNISIPEALKTFIEGKVTQGVTKIPMHISALSSSAERQRDQLSASYRSELAAGQADLDAGDFTEFDDQSLASLADDIKRVGRQRMTTPDAKSPRS